MRVFELFAGIGGCAVALGPHHTIVAAVDQDQAASLAYRHLHGHDVIRHNLHHARPAWFERVQADLWWMSPPCQPYTIRGHQRDLDDPRAQAFQRVVAAIEALRPRAIGLENVPWFQGSRSEALILSALERSGYTVHTQILCPTELGVPAQRRRYYLVASLDGLHAPTAPSGASPRWQDWIAPFDPALQVPDELASRYEGALHTIDAQDPDAVSVCFTGAYARSPVHAGSYLRQDGRVRWFSPVEIARSLGFAPDFSLPPDLSRGEAVQAGGQQPVGGGGAPRAVTRSRCHPRMIGDAGAASAPGATRPRSRARPGRWRSARRPGPAA